MPRVDIPVTRLTSAGDSVTDAEVAADAANDHEFTNDGQTLLVIRNSGAGADTVTIVTPAEFGGLALEDESITVPAGETFVAGPFPPKLFNQAGRKVFVDVTTADARFAAYSLAS